MNQYIVAAYIICAQHAVGDHYEKGFEYCPLIVAEYVDEQKALAASKREAEKDIVARGVNSLLPERRMELAKRAGLIK